VAGRKRKLLRTEADVVASIDEEVANDSDSDADCVPEISNSEESADKNDILYSYLGPSIVGFCTKDCQPSIPVFTGNPGVQFAVQNGADVMDYVDNYISPELTETVVNQTNLYAQQQIATML
jgi:hypothetical protein